MANHKKPLSLRRRFVTLIEMMIVMFLIALITGVVAYNYRGSLDEGKAFKTKAGIEKLQTILSLALAENPNADLSQWREIVSNSPLVQNPDALIKDGWGNEYAVTVVEGNVVVTSTTYDSYKQNHKSSMFK